MQYRKYHVSECLEASTKDVQVRADTIIRYGGGNQKNSWCGDTSDLLELILGRDP